MKSFKTRQVKAQIFAETRGATSLDGIVAWSVKKSHKKIALFQIFRVSAEHGPCKIPIHT